MCGIAGFIDLRMARKPEALRAQAEAMGNAIRHRGPDGDGVFVESEAGLAFAHRRLSIVDVSPAGAQPMASTNGRFVICYNGEIYNAEEMRQESALAGIQWCGHSDTEVILEYAAAYGFERMLQRANGMFAMAMWDRQERVLHLARDRMGIKPLFVAALPQGLAFASELKGIRQVLGFEAEIEPSAVASFLRLAYVPAPDCIYRNVHKLMPGTYERIDAASLEHGYAAKSISYWSLRDAAEAGRRNALRMNDEAATEALAILLSDAIKRQLMSDVPLGALLSGGIDSSAIVALMTEASLQTVRTFSIGFESAEFDESHHAAAVARHLRTEHTELRVTPKEALDTIPRLADIYDEPFADSSQIPTYLVSKLTRQHVTVALSGDGGDELFAGYNRHKFAAGIGGRLQHIPRIARRLAGAAIAAAPSQGISLVAALLPAGLRPPQAADKAAKLARILGLDTAEIYQSLVSQIESVELIAPALVSQSCPAQATEEPQFETMLEFMQYHDMIGYLPDDILQKVDRASMAAALEVRPPFLDHRVVEFAWRLEPSLKIRRGQTKWLLRQVLARKVPPSLTDRPKMGFAVPLADWLRGPLRAWAWDLLQSNGWWSNVVSRKAIVGVWERHQSGRENLAYVLWPVLMLAAWCARPTS